MAPKWLGKKIGRFRLQGLLGQGAVGRVFRAEDAILHRRVALKVIVVHSENGQVNRGADTFLTEARAAAALEHPNVVQIFEAGETGNLCYIAMELLEGGSLKDLVAASGALDPGRACLLAADAADALAAAHQAGIVHRDVKPANLMLTRQGRCKVTDFGLATFGDADSVSRERAAGTPQFAAPEVIRGTAADEQSDVYSLGATLFYLLSGRPPYTGKTRSEVLRKHLDEPIPDLRVLRPGLPESLVQAVERSLDKDPGRRFQTALQFARVLRVQTIPALPLPGMMSAGDTVGGVSVLNLSGMTAVTGSTGNLRAGGPTAAAGGGALTANDLGEPVVPRTNAPSDPASHVEHPVPSPVAYATPSTPRRPWWAQRTGLLAVAATAIVTLLGVLLFRPRESPTDVSTSATVAPPTLLPPGSAIASPVVPAPVVATLRPTDLDPLTKIANGVDPAHPGGRVTLVGTVSRTTLSPSGRAVRVQFAQTPFAVVYFDDGDLYARMNKQYGENAAGLVGKAVRFTGRVKMYGKYPEMIIASPGQVAVVNPSPSPDP